MMDGKTEESPRILELHPGHPIIKNLDVLAQRSPDSPKIKSWAELLYQQALLAEGVLKDPARLVEQIAALLTEVSANRDREETGLAWISSDHPAESSSRSSRAAVTTIP